MIEQVGSFGNLAKCSLSEAGQTPAGTGEAAAKDFPSPSEQQAAGEPASLQSAFDPQAKSPNVIQNLLGWANGCGQDMNRIQSNVLGFMDSKSGDPAKFDHGTMVGLLSAQIDMHKVAMNVEMVSKTVEMGTNGINTLARTQT